MTFLLIKGLFEYVRPKWQKRARPVVDEQKVNSFGASVASRPLNPLKAEQQTYPPVGNLEGTALPR